MLIDLIIIIMNLSLSSFSLFFVIDLGCGDGCCGIIIIIFQRLEEVTILL